MGGGSRTPDRTSSTHTSTLGSDDPIYRWVCVAAHQAAEKAFKAALIKAQIEFPRIHDLERLQRLLPAGSELHDLDVDLASLTEWAMQGRYPADTRDANRHDAEQAVRDAHTVVDAVATTFDEPEDVVETFATFEAGVAAKCGS